MEKRHLPEKIEGERILLTKLKLDSAQNMFDYVSSERSRYCDYIPWVDRTKTYEDQVKYVASTIVKWESSELFEFSMFLKSNQTYLGNIGVYRIAWESNRCELGYWIAEKFEGKGYVSEALHVLEKACFDIGFHRIEIRCSSENNRSSEVAKKNGYHLDGRLIEDMLVRNRYQDTLVFGKINPTKAFS